MAAKSYNVASEPGAGVAPLGVRREGEPMPRDCFHAALDYAARGWSVLPIHWPLARGGCSCGEPGCPSPGKHPMLPRWENYATNDSGTLAGWWAQAPEANVGIACGVSG